MLGQLLLWRQSSSRSSHKMVEAVGRLVFTPHVLDRATNQLAAVGELRFHKLLWHRLLRCRTESMNYTLSHGRGAAALRSEPRCQIGGGQG